MTTITIIGANSFIARNLISRYDKETELFLYDIGPDHLDGEQGYTQVNLLSNDSVSTMNLKTDLIYIFSGKTGSTNGFELYSDFIDINEKVLLNILNEYRIQNAKGRIVFPSTRLVYKGSENTLVENDDKEFKTLYAMNKYACENYLEMFKNAFDIKYTILRICVPYGTSIPNASSYGTLEFMLNQANESGVIKIFGDGKQRRTFTHMGYLCEVLDKAPRIGETLNEIYNVGGEDFSIIEVAQQIATLKNAKVELTEWPELALRIESGSTVFNSSKLDRILGIVPEMNFRDWLDSK